MKSNKQFDSAIEGLRIAHAVAVLNGDNRLAKTLKTYLVRAGVWDKPVGKKK